MKDNIEMFTAGPSLFETSAAKNQFGNFMGRFQYLIFLKGERH